MILVDVITDSAESAWYEFAHERRNVLVRYVHGPMGIRIRTEKQAIQAAFDALAAEDGRDLIVR